MDTVSVSLSTTPLSAAGAHPIERMLDSARLGDHLDRLYRAAWALCGSRENAEDLVQETYARVLARPRLLLGVGAVLGTGWVAALAAGRAEDEHGRQIIPLWFLAGLVALLYLIWCGGLWLGLRLRRARAVGSGA